MKSGEADWGSVGYAWAGVFSLSLCSCLYGLGHGQIDSGGWTMARGGVEEPAAYLYLPMTDQLSLKSQVRGTKAHIVEWLNCRTDAFAGLYTQERRAYFPSDHPILW